MKRLFIILALIIPAACNMQPDEALIRKIDTAAAAIDSLSSAYTYMSVERTKPDGSVSVLMTAFDNEKPVIVRNMFEEFPVQELVYYLSPQTGQIILVREIKGSDNAVIETRYYYDNRKFVCVFSGNMLKKLRISGNFLTYYDKVEDICNDMIESLKEYNAREEPDDLFGAPDSEADSTQL